MEKPRQDTLKIGLKFRLNFPNVFVLQPRLQHGLVTTSYPLGRMKSHRMICCALKDGTDILPVGQYMLNQAQVIALR